MQTLKQLSAQLKNKQVSATELAQSYLDRIAASDLNAFTGVNAELTLAQAKEADARIAAGTAGDLTGLPAARLGLADRGRLAPGCCADLVLLDWARYPDRGTVEAPSQLAQGVEMVLVNGGAVLAQGQATGVRTGRVIR